MSNWYFFYFFCAWICKSQYAIIEQVFWGFYYFDSLGRIAEIDKIIKEYNNLYYHTSSKIERYIFRGAESETKVKIKMRLHRHFNPNIVLCLHPVAHLKNKPLLQLNHTQFICLSVMVVFFSCHSYLMHHGVREWEFSFICSM